ncbi:MAG TPA: hypothetical protein VET24_16695 [Actinomycetota bacterium]|nr:hypothetical protein [Actinomycetota bacterium]
MAGRQHGVITRAQMRRADITEDSIRWKGEAGLIEEVLPNVFRLGGAAQTWEQRLSAACLWGGPDAVACHKSAAVLWGLGGFGPGPVEISTLKQNRLSLPFKVHRSAVSPAFTTRKLGIPVTNGFRTVRDLVFILEGDRADQVFDEALLKGLISIDAMRRMVERETGHGRRGIRALRRLLDERDPNYQASASELQRLVRKVLIAGGMSDFVEEYVVLDEDGNFIARGDFGFVEDWTIVEAEGRANHTSKLDFRRDLERRNRLTAAGWATVHTTWDQVRNRREEFLEAVRKTRERQRRLRA